MKAETAASLLEAHHIHQNPAAPALLAAGLSLLLPGLGQAYLGQWSRGLRVFAGSATLCFGLGLANVLTAYDAYSLAKRNQTADITSRTSSKTLRVFGAFWMAFCLVIDRMADSLSSGPGFLLSLPLMLISHLAGGKGFQR